MTKVLWPRIIQALVILFWGAVVAAPFMQHAAIATGRWVQAAVVLAAVQAISVGVVTWPSRGIIRGAGVALTFILLAVVAIRAANPHGALAALLATSGVSHAFLYGSLLLVFGQTLLHGRRPLVTSMALRLETTLTPAMMVYTRRVTLAWCGFFAGQLALSGALLVLAPHAVWSLFVNVLDGPMVALMFAAEYGLRRLLFRNVRHVSPVAIIRSFTRDRPAFENG